MLELANQPVDVDHYDLMAQRSLAEEALEFWLISFAVGRMISGEIS